VDAALAHRERITDSPQRRRRSFAPPGSTPSGGAKRLCSAVALHSSILLLSSSGQVMEPWIVPTKRRSVMMRQYIAPNINRSSV
jgi:hypothetical protein